jgi:CBS domain containing-hemolysin-like protein
MATVGRLPVQGEEIEVAGVRLLVERMDGRRVERVRVVMRPGQDTGSTG